MTGLRFVELESQPEDVIQTQAIDSSPCFHQFERNCALIRSFSEPQLDSLEESLTRWPVTSRKQRKYQSSPSYWRHVKTVKPSISSAA